METWVFFRGLCSINTTPALECEKLERATKEDVQAMALRMKLDTVYFLRGKEINNG